jgi:pimeloyl-ACP methyl ester carboxylesterase
MFAWSAAWLGALRAPSTAATSADITRHSVRSADGTIISYAQLGAGHAIVFSHESLASGVEWMQVATLLSDRFSCYIVDRRGRGKSGPAGNHSLAAECGDLRAVMEKAAPQATLMAASYGAIVAIETALRFGADRLILYEPPLVLNAESPIARSLRESLEPYRKLVEAGSLDEALTYGLVSFAGVPAGVVADIKSSSPEAWATMRNLTPSWIPELETIKQMPLGIERYRALPMPILLVSGCESPEFLRAVVDGLGAVLPDSRRFTLPGHGHEGHLTAPDQLAAGIAEFLADAPG